MTEQQDEKKQDSIWRCVEQLCPANLDGSLEDCYVKEKHLSMLHKPLYLGVLFVTAS